MLLFRKSRSFRPCIWQHLYKSVVPVSFLYISLVHNLPFAILPMLVTSLIISLDHLLLLEILSCFLRCCLWIPKRRLLCMVSAHFTLIFHIITGVIPRIPRHWHRRQDQPVNQI